MSKVNTNNAVSVPALSLANAESELLAFIANNPDAAKAIALASLLRGNSVPAKRERFSPSAAAQETETERVLRIAHFSASDARGKIVAFALARLGDANEVSVTERELCEHVGLSQDKIRGPLKICERRINDRTSEGLGRFPLLPTLGYEAAIDGSRGEEKVFILSRIVPVAKAASKPRKPAKAKEAAQDTPASDGASSEG